MDSGGSVEWSRNQVDPLNVAAHGRSVLACGCIAELSGCAWTAEISTDLDLLAFDMLSGRATKDVSLEEAARGVRQPLWTTHGSTWIGGLFSKDRHMECPFKLDFGIIFPDCAAVRAWKRLIAKMESLVTRGRSE
jgi:hypothetical protein